MSTTLRVTYGTDLTPATPLWRRVPTRDLEGRRLSDFMMLIPKLRHRPAHQLQATLNKLQEIFEHYADVIVFADLNLKLNVLWVSVKPRPGICLELPALIHAHIPEAKLVAQPPEHAL